MFAVIACTLTLMFVLLAMIYSNQRPKKNQHFVLPTLRYYNEDQRKIDVKARGFQINTKQKGTNEHEKAKNAKLRS